MWQDVGRGVSYLPLQDLRLATEEAMAVVTAQVNAPLRASMLEGRKTDKGARCVQCWRMGRSGSLFALPRSTYPSSPTLSLLPLPLSLVQGLEYLELGPAAGAAELVDCAINFVVVTRVREAAAAEAAGSGRAWGIERKRERKRKKKREHIEGVR